MPYAAFDGGNCVDGQADPGDGKFLINRKCNSDPAPLILKTI